MTNEELERKVAEIIPLPYRHIVQIIGLHLPHNVIVTLTHPRSVPLNFHIIEIELERLFPNCDISFNDYYHPVLTEPFQYSSFYIKRRA